MSRTDAPRRGLFPLPGLNERLLWRVLDTIRTRPAQWDQRWWVRDTRCRTTYCLAGRTTAIHLGVPNLPLMVRRIARDALGLSDLRAAMLFDWTSVRRTGRLAALLPWRTTRHPTFAELVDRVEWVTGFRYDPDRPPSGPDDDDPQPEERDPVPVIRPRQPAPDRALACVA